MKYTYKWELELDPGFGDEEYDVSYRDAYDLYSPNGEYLGRYYSYEEMYGFVVAHTGVVLESV